ncbi:MAG: ANTAR domain-containing response regulator [Gaiellaceae bacterium]
MTRAADGPPDRDRPTAPLRILIANATEERLGDLAAFLSPLGHDAIAHELSTPDAGAIVERERPDVALVDVGSSPGQALDLIAALVDEAAFPVIALVEANDPEGSAEIARRGAFASVLGGGLDDLPGAIDVALHRFAEVQALQGAFGRRATIEQAKGILMARHRIDAAAAFDLLRDQSQRSGRKLLDVSRAVVDSHLLLVPDLPHRHAGNELRPAPPAIEETELDALD